MIYDYCVVGGGIVGLATARALVRLRPGASVVVLEKENRLARHQTGHNSGVIHAGIYYAPGSLKAELCREGAAATKEFCTEHGIAFREPGKLLVATDEVEARRMDALFERSKENRIAVDRVSAAELRELEPRIHGVGALKVHTTGIVDFAAVCEALAGEVRDAGGHVRLGAEVTAIRESTSEVAVEADGVPWRARELVVCGGVQADRLARMAGLEPEFRIVPFRGEYYRLPDSRSDVVDHLIYPIPDPALPFLGVHLTPMIDGSITVGPNAVLGLAREKYRKFSLSPRDAKEILGYRGFWHVARNNVRTGAAELRNSLFARGYLQACRRYCPELELSDLLPHEAGIRAQAVLRDGTLVHDFLFQETERSVHVCNAPSPAATSALPIGERIARRTVGDKPA